MHDIETTISENNFFLSCLKFSLICTNSARVTITLITVCLPAECFLILFESIHSLLIGTIQLHRRLFRRHNLPVRQILRRMLLLPSPSSALLWRIACTWNISNISCLWFHMAMVPFRSRSSIPFSPRVNNTFSAWSLENNSRAAASISWKVCRRRPSASSASLRFG